MPKFHGDLLKWKDFWALFSSRLQKEPGLTDADKSCLLVKADSKAQQRAEATIAHNTCFEGDVKSLKVYYEDNCLLFKHHYDEVHKLDSFKDTIEDLDRLENRIQSAIRSMESSNGYSGPQLLVAALEKLLTPGLARQWRQFTHDHDDPPPISQLEEKWVAHPLLAFVHRQRKVAPDDRLIASTKPDKQ